MKTIKEVRKAFWRMLQDNHSKLAVEYRSSKKHNDYSADVQYAFSCFIDNLEKSKEITPELCKRVTL